MKLFVSVLAFVILGSQSFGQSYSLRAGANANLSGNTFTVGAGGTFEIQLWFTPGPASVVANTAVCSLAYDRAVGWPYSGGSFAATPTDLKLTPTTHTNYQPIVAPGSPYTVLLGSAGNIYRKGRNPLASANIQLDQLGTNMAPCVWYAGAYRGANDPLAAITSPMHIFTFEFTNSLAVGETYGDDATEAGLQVYTDGSTSTSVSGGASGISGIGGGNFGSSKYRVTATVPEPSSMAAVMFGSAFLLRRRARRA